MGYVGRERMDFVGGDRSRSRSPSIDPSRSRSPTIDHARIGSRYRGRARSRSSSVEHEESSPSEDESSDLKSHRSPSRKKLRTIHHSCEKG